MDQKKIKEPRNVILGHTDSVALRCTAMCEPFGHCCLKPRSAAASYIKSLLLQEETCTLLPASFLVHNIPATEN